MPAASLRDRTLCAPSPVAFAPFVEPVLIPCTLRVLFLGLRPMAEREGLNYEHFWNDCGQVSRDLLSVFNFSKSPRISATFFARDHFFSCRSRLMAAVASIGPSVYTKVKSFSCFACREPLPSACRRMRFETFLVCPTYSIPLRINKI